MSASMFEPYRPIHIDTLLRHPGCYEFIERFIDLPDGTTGTAVVRIEIDQDGICHQLTPGGERDGILAREGWKRDRLYVVQIGGAT